MPLDIKSYVLGKKDGQDDIELENVTVTENGVTDAPSGKAFSRVTTAIPEFDGVVAKESWFEFASEDLFTLKTKNGQQHWEGTLWYSTDKINWTVWTGSITPKAKHLYLRGKNNIRLHYGTATLLPNLNADNSWELNSFPPEAPIDQFSGIYCHGDIRVLFDYEVLPNRISMANLFYNTKTNKYLKTLPDLSVLNSLGFDDVDLTHALLGTFGGCTNLVKGSAIDFRSVQTIFSNANDGAIAAITHTAEDIPIYFGKKLVNVNAAINAFVATSSIATKYTYVFYFDENDTYEFNMAYVVTKGSNKNPIAYDIYTDCIAIKNAAINQRDQYTTVNVYHMDRSDWV